MSDQEYISGEEYRKLHSDASAPKGRKVVIPVRTAGFVAAGIVLCVISFTGGMKYQKSHGKAVTGTASSGGNSNNARGGFGFGGPGGMSRRGGTIGQVSTVTESSITVTSERTGKNITYKVTGSTTVSNNGSTAVLSDIKTGDTLLVATDRSDTSTATNILLNPSFGGRQTVPDTNSPSDTSQTN